MLAWSHRVPRGVTFVAVCASPPADPNVRVAFGYGNGYIELRSLTPTSNTLIKELHDDTSRYDDICISHDGMMLAACFFNKETVQVWSTQYGELLFTTRIRAESIAFSPTTNYLATASGNGEFHLLDRGDDIGCIYGSVNVIRHYAMEFSPDGETLIMSIVEASNGSIAPFRDVENGMIAMLPIHGGNLRTSVSTSTVGPLRLMRVSPVWDHCMFATSDRSGLSLMRTTDHATLSRIVTLPHSNTECESDLQFSPDGSELAVSFANGDVSTYSVPSGKLRRTLRRFGDSHGLVAYLPNGTQLLHATWGGEIRLFTVCDWTDRTHFLFGADLKKIVFQLMCIRDRIISTDVLPVLPMALWLHVFTYVAFHTISTTVIPYDL